MNQISLLFISFILLCSCSDAQVKSEGRASKKNSTINKVVSPDKFKELMNNENVQLVDVRTAEEYKGGKIGNAINIDYYSSSFKDEIAKLDKNRTVLVYCAAGGRSAKAAKIFSDMGFVEIYDLNGGYRNWNQ